MYIALVHYIQYILVLARLVFKKYSTVEGFDLISILHTKWLENHALTLKIIPQSIIFVKNPIFITSSNFFPQTRKTEVKFKNILFSMLQIFQKVNFNIIANLQWPAFDIRCTCMVEEPSHMLSLIVLWVVTEKALCSYTASTMCNVLHIKLPPHPCTTQIV